MSWDTKQDIVSQYMISLFQWRITPTTLERPRPPQDLSVQMLCDCLHIAAEAATAFLHPLYLPWNIEDYCGTLKPKQSGLNSATEEELATRFPVSAESEEMYSKNPVVVVDSEGNIVLWHLPNAISRQRQAIVWNSVSSLNGIIKKPSRPSWRANPDLFFSEATTLRSGLLTLSPAWFQVGHEHEKPEVSVDLKEPEGPARTWTKRNQEFSHLVGGLLAITHPQLYNQCMETFRDIYKDPGRYLRTPEEFRTVMDSWSNPLGGLALICNRETPLHRDNSSRYYWYDILATFGTYDGLHIRVPGIRRCFSYEPGTFLVLSGRAFTHEVPAANGERICFAYFVRDKVLGFTGRTEGTWPKRRASHLEKMKSATQ